MKAKRPVRVGIFSDPTAARRVLDEAFRLGFRDVHVVAADVAAHATLLAHPAARKVRRATPGEISRRSILIGALVGLLVGFAGAWFAHTRGIFVGISNVVWPIAGVIWGAFIGGMVSRGFTLESQDFYDQELAPDEILVAIEDDDPARLSLAEQLLRHEGVAAVPLREG